MLNDGAHRHAGAGIAEEQDAGEAGNRRHRQCRQPVGGDARIAKGDDIVEILVAAIVGGEGERGRILYDDRDAEGAVERRRGVRTLVSAPKIHFNKLMSYTEQMGSRSLNACSRVLLAKIIDDEQDVNARLALSPKSKVVKIERLRHAGDEPFALETCYLSAAQFSGSKWFC